MAGDLKITQIGICYIDPQTRDHDIELYKINPAAANTVMIYKNFKVTANFVNLDPADFQPGRGSGGGPELMQLRCLRRRKGGFNQCSKR